MKKIILSINFCVLAIGISLSQVGVNTDNPKAIFHIDAKKDNGNISVPVNTSDDVIFKPGTNNDLDPTAKLYGHLGVGKVNPDTGLDVNGNIRLEDGTQVNNNILVSTDSLGNAQWIAPARPLIHNGEIGNGIRLPLDESAIDLTVQPLMLTQGRWLILSKFVVKATQHVNDDFKPRNNVWIYLKNVSEHPLITDKVYNTILGVPLEQAGAKVGTPQLAALVNIPKGKTFEYRVFGSTSNKEFEYITTNDDFQGSYFYAVRLDAELLDD